MSRILAWLWVGGVFCVALFGFVAAPHDPYATGLRPPAEAPGHLLLGADTLGRDLLSRVLYGGALTVSAGAAAALIAWIGGGLLALADASRIPLLRGAANVLNIALLALPAFFIALVVVTGLGASLISAAVAAGIAQIGIAGQVWRGVVSQVLREPYIEAAAAIGATRIGILRRHVLPNVLPLLIIYACTLFASSLLFTASLSFLGLAGDLAVPHWGNMLAEGRAAIRYAPHVMLVPAVALLLVTAALNTAASLLNRRG